VTVAESLQKIVLHFRAEFDDWLLSYHRDELHESLNEKLAAAIRVADDYEIVRVVACEECLGPVRGLHQRLRERLVDMLDEQAVRTISLGEWVDRGARPENVHQHMRKHGETGSGRSTTDRQLSPEEL